MLKLGGHHRRNPPAALAHTSASARRDQFPSLSARESAGPARVGKQEKNSVEIYQIDILLHLQNVKYFAPLCDIHYYVSLRNPNGRASVAPVAASFSRARAFSASTASMRAMMASAAASTGLRARMPERIKNFLFLKMMI